MSLKTVIIATVIWTLAIVGMAIGCIAYIANNQIPGVSKETRANTAGQGIGILGGIGYGAIWLPFAARMGAERRARLLKPKSKKKKSSVKRRRPVDDDV